MKIEKNLLDLTNKYMEEFLKMANKNANKGKGRGKGKRCDTFHFSHTMAEVFGQSNYPRYEDENSLLMSMSSFDDSIAKVFFNNRIQGFVKIIEDRLAYKGEQEDYLVENIKITEYLKDDFDLEWYIPEGKTESTFKTVKCKTNVEQTTFDVRNTRSGFAGRVVLKKELSKEFINKNDFVEKMVTQSVDFYVGTNEIMSINNKYNFEKFGADYYEEATFTHYKYIADVNSFYLVIGCY